MFRDAFPSCPSGEAASINRPGGVKKSCFSLPVAGCRERLEGKGRHRGTTPSRRKFLKGLHVRTPRPVSAPDIMTAPPWRGILPKARFVRDGTGKAPGGECFPCLGNGTAEGDDVSRKPTNFPGRPPPVGLAHSAVRSRPLREAPAKAKKADSYSGLFPADDLQIPLFFTNIATLLERGENRGLWKAHKT